MFYCPGAAGIAAISLVSLAHGSPTSSWTGNSLSTTDTPTSTSVSESQNPTTSSQRTSTGESSTSQVAGPTLLPAVHWEYPVDDIRNLAPVNTSDLYYSYNGISDPSVQHLFASMSTNFTYDAVVLDHSGYVKNTSCGSQGINVTFVGNDGFAFASEAWQQADDFVLVTYTDGCGTSNDQRTFWLTNGQDGITLDNNTNSILVGVEREIAIEDALHGVDMVWGTYYPPESDPTGPSTSATARDSSSSSAAVSPRAAQITPTPPEAPPASSNPLYGSVASNGSPCEEPPAAQIQGFPAVQCGSSAFDSQLDAAIGYRNFSVSSFAASIEAFIPGIQLSQEDLSDDDAGLIPRSIIRKRGWFSSAFDFVKKTVSNVVHGAVDISNQVQSQITSALSNVAIAGDFIAQATTVRPSIQGSADVNLGPYNNAASPWGNAALLYQQSPSSGGASGNVALYCVNCGFSGHMVLAGSATFNIVNGLQALRVNTDANIQVGLDLGIVASAKYSNTQRKSLINQAIPNLGVSVPGVFSAGCFIAVDAVAELNVAAAGQALVGVTMTVPNFQARLDLTNQYTASQSSITGYSPQWATRFEAGGEISASAQLSLPVSFNIGLQIIPLKVSKNIALIEQPSLYGNASYSASTQGGSCNNGISYFSNVQNDILFDFLGLQTFTLNHYDSPPLVLGCKLFSRSISARQAGPPPGNTVIVNNQTSIFPSNPGDLSDTTNKPTFDDGTTPNNAEFNATTAQAQSLATVATGEDGLNFTTVSEMHGAFQLAPDANGNIYTTAPSNSSDNGTYLFAEYQGAIIGDDRQRSFFFYPDFMAAFNVSRLRLGYEFQIPQTATAIALAPMPAANHTLMAVDSKSNAYALVLCHFSNGANSKIFIVGDQSGLNYMTQVNARYTVAGAPVLGCQPVALQTRM